MTFSGSFQQREFHIDGMIETKEPRVNETLADYLRRTGRTSVKVGCAQGVCGSCSVLFGGDVVRSCLILAIQAEGTPIQTVAGIEAESLKGAFHRNGGLQCGYCTPGFLVLAHDFLERMPDPDREEVREAMSANICRCTGYQGIIDAVMDAAKTREVRWQEDENSEN